MPSRDDLIHHILFFPLLLLRHALLLASVSVFWTRRGLVVMKRGCCSSATGSATAVRGATNLFSSIKVSLVFSFLKKKVACHLIVRLIFSRGEESYR